MSFPTKPNPAADSTSSAMATRTDALSHRGSAINPSDSEASAVDKKCCMSSLIRLLVSLLAATLPVVVALVLYQALQFDAADLAAESYSVPDSIPNHDAHVLPLIDRLAEGLTPGPEDFAYDAGSRTLYTGCLDGWIRRVRLADDGGVAAVDKWAYVGGRPLGVALAPPGSDRQRRLYVANADLGLMAVDDRGDASPPTVTLLVAEADGLRFALADGVDVAADGTVYFTDASWKYSLATHMIDILEGRPNGRLLRYDPRTNSTQVLVDGLYFANGVSMEPHGEFVVFCETFMRRCFRYYIAGEKEGQTDVFIGNLPGFPDNIRYDGAGRYWIAIPSSKSWAWDILLRYRWARKLAFVASKYVHVPGLMANAGVVEVGLDGTAISFRSDPKLSHVTVGLRVGDHLYLGYLVENYISSIPLVHSPN